MRPSQKIDPDDAMYVKNLLEMADRKGWDDPEVDWMIQRAANEFDPERIICVLLLSWLATLQTYDKVPVILAYLDQFCTEAMTEDRALHLGGVHG